MLFPWTQNKIQMGIEIHFRSALFNQYSGGKVGIHSTIIEHCLAHGFDVSSYI